MSARPAQPGGRCSCQCRTMPAWDRVKPTNTPMANSGISAWVSPLDTTSSTAARGREHADAVAVDLALGLQREHVRQVVVPGQQAGQDRQAAEGGVRGQGEQDQS